METKPEVEIVAITTAAQANDLHKRIVDLGSILKQEALSLGKFLSDQKVKAGRGKWQDWMKKNLAFTERTAQRYIQIYERRNEIGWGEVLALADGESENRQGMSDLKEDPSPAAVSANPANPIQPTAPAASLTQAIKKLTKSKRSNSKRKPTPAEAPKKFYYYVKFLAGSWVVIYVREDHPLAVPGALFETARSAEEYRAEKEKAEPEGCEPAHNDFYYVQWMEVDREYYVADGSNLHEAFD